MLFTSPAAENNENLITNSIVSGWKLKDWAMATDKVVHMYNTVVYSKQKDSLYVSDCCVTRTNGCHIKVVTMVVILRWLQWLLY